MRIAVVRPGHALSTLFVSAGLEEGLKSIGVEVDEVRTERLIAMQSLVVTQFWDKYEKLGHTPIEIAQHAGLEQVLARLLYLEYDLILLVNGRLFSPQIMRGFDKLPGPKVVWLKESPYEDEWQRHFVDHFDFAFVNDKVSVPVMNEVVPSVYLPHSYDPETFMRIERQQNIDVFFCYTAFNNRVPVVDQLSSSGLKCVLPKAGTVYDESSGITGVSFVPPERVAHFYNTSKICLNVHRTEKLYGSGEQITQAYSLGPRAYEIAACGAFQLSDNTRPELTEVFGDTVATYDNPDDIVEQCRYWLDPARDKQRVEMGLASMERVRECTYAHRAAQVVKQLAQWYNQPEWLIQSGEAEHEKDTQPALQNN